MKQQLGCKCDSLGFERPFLPSLSKLEKEKRRPLQIQLHRTYSPITYSSNKPIHHSGNLADSQSVCMQAVAGYNMLVVGCGTAPFPPSEFVLHASVRCLPLTECKLGKLQPLWLQSLAEQLWPFWRRNEINTTTVIVTLLRVVSKSAVLASTTLQ